jgi:prolyl-tRNA synthetase
MKYSKLGIKTNKDAKDFDSANATLLTKGGFINQTMAGVYTFLPLGLRVLNKIEQIVREEMDKVGVEVLMPALAPKQLWETTGRLDTVDVLMKTSGANKASENKSSAEYVLNSTHEEVITPIAQEFNPSYKDFPFAYYQIQSKFRNEARAKSGILRGREFRMKDLYSFHLSEADLKEYYETVKQTYVTIFERLGLGDATVISLASGGDFTKDYSHEFQTRLEAGEDVIFFDKKLGIGYNKEVAPSKAPTTKQETELKEMQEVETKGITGVKALVMFMNTTVEQTTKTMIFETDDGRVIAAALRGDYEINEEKLTKVVGCGSLQLASAQTVKKVTGAEIGYAGLLGLPKEVEIYMDDSMEGRTNFEMGANKTDYHNAGVNFGRDLEEPEQFYDFKTAKEGDLNPETGEIYEVFAAAEVGNIFPLNTKFTKAFGYTYTDDQGKEQDVYMGSYGIGTSRVMGVLVEKYHDEKGIIWPKQVAPFQAYLISLRGGEEMAQDLYDQLQAKGVEVLWDDRDTSAGAKFGDADLLGIPTRLVISKKTEGKVEWKNRESEETALLSIDEVVDRLSV